MEIPYLAIANLGIIVVGCFGNFLSLILFLKQTSSVNTLLAALSFVDMCLLLIAVPVFVMPHMPMPSFSYYPYILKYVYPINLMMQTCSIYIMVLITMERWTAVCRPLQVRIWCTPKTSLRALCGIVVFAICYNSVRFLEYSIVYSQNTTNYEKNLRSLELHPNYMIFYNTGLYLLTHFLIPFGVIIVMNGHVCKSIIALRRARLMLTRQQQREQSTTMMLLVVTLIFAVCNTLPFLLNFAECIKPDLFDDPKTAGFAFSLNDVSNSLVMLNSATTFIVYLAFSEKYRQGAVWILTGCCYSYEKDLKYNSLQSRTHSLHANSSFYRSSKRDSYRGSQELFLKPFPKTERSSSECNERIKKPQLCVKTSDQTDPKTLNALSAANRFKNRDKSTGRDSPSGPHNLNPYRQQTHPGNEAQKPMIIEQRRMSDNPQVLRSSNPSTFSGTPISVNIKKSKLSSSSFSPTSSYSGKDSPVPSVIITLLKNSSSASTEALHSPE